MTLRFFSYVLLLAGAAGVGLRFYVRLSTASRFLLLLVITTLVSELTGRMLSHTVGSSMPVYHFLLFSYFILYAIIYKYLTSPHSKQWIVYVGILGALLSLANSLFLQTLYVFPSYSLLLLSVFNAFMSLSGFHRMLRDSEASSPTKEPAFWFCTGNLFFYCITFFVFGYINPVLEKLGKLPEWSYLIIYFANLWLYTCYLISFVAEVRKPTSAR